jgi:hypothetical protein
MLSTRSGIYHFFLGGGRLPHPVTMEDHVSCQRQSPTNPLGSRDWEQLRRLSWAHSVMLCLRTI